MSSKKRRTDEDEGGARKKFAASSSSRTGQACDRCKIRKIRCDARPGGCSPCLQNNTECKTTDRITGRATARGHTEQLENENASLKMYMVELQQQLREQGVEPKPAPPTTPHFVAAQPSWQQDVQPETWPTLEREAGEGEPGDRHDSGNSMLSDFRPGCFGDNYLGVSADINGLTPIEGSSLALFGMKIDLAEFTPTDSDPTSAPNSYKTIVHHAFGKAPHAVKPTLPKLEQCQLFAEWFFRSVINFTPILHKAEFMKLLSRFYSTQYTPLPSETVMVHMMLSMMNFQYSSRNRNSRSFTDAMAHYHYALGFVPDLMKSHTLQDMQALTLICAQMRSQARPGPAYMFMSLVLSLAIEMGLHRSADAWQGYNTERDPHAIEIRKRVFWSLMSLHISISGFLGRPMPMRLDDIDIELPQLLPDYAPGEQDLSPWRQCTYRAAIPSIKCLKILAKTYYTVYSISASPESYAACVNHIERELQAWRAELPPELDGGPLTIDEDRVACLYLQLIECQTRLILHHPSVSLTQSPLVAAHSMDVCMDVSAKLLSLGTQMKALKSLDSTWYTSTIFLAGLFTQLFVQTQRQDRLSLLDVQRLRQDVDAWVDVMGDIGFMLGTGQRLQEAISGIVNSSFANIEQHVAARTAAAAAAASADATSGGNNRRRSHQQAYTDTNGYSDDYSTNVPSSDTASDQRHYPLSNNALAAQQLQPPYPSASQPFYPSPATNGTIQHYNPTALQDYDASAYGTSTDDLKRASMDHASLTPTLPQNPQQQQQLPPPTQTSSADYLTALQQQQQQQQQQHQHLPNGFPASHLPASIGPAAWRDFTQGMITQMPASLGGQEYMTSANTLMALQGGAAGGAAGGMGKEAEGLDQMGGVAGLQHMAAAAAAAAAAGDDGSQKWPLLLMYGNGGTN